MIKVLSRSGIPLEVLTLRGLCLWPSVYTRLLENGRYLLTAYNDTATSLSYAIIEVNDFDFGPPSLNLRKSVAESRLWSLTPAIPRCVLVFASYMPHEQRYHMPDTSTRDYIVRHIGALDMSLIRWASNNWKTPQTKCHYSHQRADPHRHSLLPAKEDHKIAYDTAHYYNH